MMTGKQNNSLRSERKKMKEMRVEIRVQKLINGRWRWSTVVVVVVMVLRQGTYIKECEEFLPFRPFSHYQKERREVTKL